MMRKRRYAAFCLTISFTALLSAQTRSMDLRTAIKGSLMFVAEDAGLEADAAPLYPMIGLGLNSGSGSFEMELSLDVYGAYFLYSEADKRPYAAAPENREAVAFGFIAAFPLGLRVRLIHQGRFRLFAGPALDFKLCLPATGIESEQSALNSATKAISSYYLDTMRWFLPVAGLGIDFPYTNNLALGAELRVWFPVYRLLSGEGRHFWDDGRAALSFRLSFL